MTVQIPRRIIQTGARRDGSLLAQASAVNLRLLNPDFEYCFFDDTDVQRFMQSECVAYQKCFHSFKYPIQRYDFFRYLAVYRLGGFYFDLDVLLAKGLTDLLRWGCVFPFEELTRNQFLRKHHHMDWEIGNYAFGAFAGHPFILSVIENCVRAQREPEWLSPMMAATPRVFWREHYVLVSTGPGLVTRTLAEYPDAARQVRVLFPDDVCDPNNRSRFGEYGIHLMEGTWRSKRSAFRKRLFRVWAYWKDRALLRESRVLGKARLLTRR